MRRLILWTVTVLLASSRTIEAADPLFENRTPVGFNPADSTTVQDLGKVLHSGVFGNDNGCVLNEGTKFVGVEVAAYIGCCLVVALQFRYEAPLFCS